MTAFFLGLLTSTLAGAGAGFASIPHCAGMCGPLVAGVCHHRSATLAYQVGRSASYAMVGALSGLAGSVLGEAPVASTIVSFLFAAGLFVSAFFAVRRAFSSDVQSDGVHHASGSADDLVKLGKKRTGGTSLSSGSASTLSPSLSPSLVARGLRVLAEVPGAAGFFSVLLPCGALYAMLLIAAASGSVPGGAAVGMSFAIVTGVGLVGSAEIAARLRQSRVGNVAVALVLLSAAVFVGYRTLSQEPDAPESCHAEQDGFAQVDFEAGSTELPSEGGGA